MAALAEEQLFDEAGDNDFAIYADLAKQRAARKGQSIEITERERVTIAANDNATGPEIGRTTAATSSPVVQRYGSAPANDTADSPAGVGAIEQPSPAFVTPEPAANGVEPEQTESQPPTESAASPAATDAVPGASPNGVSRADAPDYADQFNKAPETGNAPLVGDDGESVGIQRAADPALGAQDVSVTGNESAPRLSPGDGDENDAQQPGMIDRAKNSLKQGVNDNMSGLMAFKNRKKIKELQDAINKLEEEIKKVERELDILNKKIADYKKKEITPLERKALTAAFADAGVAIRNYLLIMVEIWWWTIIGAIIDICLVVPTIAILYGSGALKGNLGKLIEKELTKKKRVFKAMEKTRRPHERQIFRFRQEQQQLAEQQFQLTQLFKLEQQQAAAGGPPSPGGIPLAS